MASIDPAAYVRSLPPFDGLPATLFEGAARALDVVYHPAGKRLVHAGGEPLRHLHVIRKGAVRIERDGQTLQLLEEGELFGYSSLLSGEASLDVVVEDDLLAYRLPEEAFSHLLSDGHFAAHFAVGLAERLRASLERRPDAALQADYALEARSLVRRPARWIGADATVRDAARAMRDERISSVLVSTDPPSILTDRDLRNRVLADDLGPETPVTRIASSPLLMVPEDTPVYAAWRTLLDADVHHLPLLRGGEVAGVLTSGDLLRHSARGPISVLRTVERLPGREALAGYAALVADMASALVAGGLDATVIAGFVARLNDVLAHRILRWAEADLGEPPAPYAWIVFGSEGRMEQTLLTDQDNLLAYADEGGGSRAWFQAFAERVNEDLVAAGFPPCPGGHMARNNHGTLSEWRRRFDAAVDAPRPHDAEILFDFRRIGGRLDVSSLEEAVSRSARLPLFLHLLASEALEFSPPGVIALRIKGDSSVVDLKKHGLVPIAFLARCYGLEAGSTARTTLDRLEAAHRAGLVGEEALVSITGPYRYLLGLRLRLQLRMLSSGEPLSNEVALGALPALERTRLKDAFRAIRTWQSQAVLHYQVRGR